ncbi:MAG: quinolinate synthase NadA, partial [Bdellovibrionales bacterium]
MSQDLVSKIQSLKKERNAVILAHYYEDGDIQDIADHVGDSFYLAKMGQKSQADVILLAGVVFMAESVKILNPTKKVLVPDMAAGCSLVESSPFEDYLQWRKNNLDAICVTYINSSAEVKAISDVIVTSSNAAQILDAIPKERKILFGPDQHLGRYLSKKYSRPMEFWRGACQVHILFDAQRLHELTLKHPEAVVIAHPECEDAVLRYAHVIGSTSRLLEEVEKNPAKKFIVATEQGIFHQMAKARPDVELIQAPIDDGTCNCNNCPFMKMNNLEKIANALETLQPQVMLNENVRHLAQVSLDRMMSITSGKQVTWPQTFQFEGFK